MRGASDADYDKFPSGCLVTTGIGEQTIIFANDYFHDRLGFTAGSLIGQPVPALLTPASRIIFDSFIVPMLKHEGRVEEILLEVLSSDAERIPVVVNAVIERAGEGYIYWSMFRAVQRNRLYQELTQTRDLAEKANKAKSRFLSGMSHELRTPMNAILGFAQIMKSDSSLPENHQDKIAEIMKAGSHLLNLINDVLDLARVEAGQLDLSMATVNVNSTIEDVLAMAQPLADQRELSYHHTPGKSLAVWADPTRLKQALLNLVSNAIKYNRQGGKVTLNVQRDDTNTPARIRICVTDTGPGIEPEELSGLSRPFNRLQNKDNGIEGTGIGLTITRHVVEAMDGSLGVTSEVGVGSTFWIELPESQPQSPAPDEKAQEPEHRNSTGEPMLHTVLYIEDSPVNLKLVEEFLRLHGKTRMVPADSPEKGIELASSIKPALILLDINMPGLDGYQVLEILRAKPELADIPIVAMSANASPADVRRGKAAGFDGYLTKPLNLKTFFEVLDQQLAPKPG